MLIVVHGLNEQDFREILPPVLCKQLEDTARTILGVEEVSAHLPCCLLREWVGGLHSNTITLEARHVPGSHSQHVQLGDKFFGILAKFVGDNKLGRVTRLSVYISSHTPFQLTAKRSGDGGFLKT